MLVGFGYDIHRLKAGLPMTLGGVEIGTAQSGPIAHSDGDVLIHALCDALLGAVALGDIGEHFPDTDAAYKGIRSIELLRQVVTMLHERGLKPHNIDCMVLLERPKLAPFRSQMRSTLAEAIGIPETRVSIKATTGEGLGAIGTGDGF